MYTFIGTIVIVLCIAALLKFAEWLDTPQKEEVLPRRKHRRKKHLWN